MNADTSAVDRCIMEIIDAELKIPSRTHTLLTTWFAKVAKAVNERDVQLGRLLNNFHGNMPGGYMWESMKAGHHDEDGIQKGCETVPYSSVFCADVQTIIDDLVSRQLIPDGYEDHRNRYQSTELNTQMRLTDFRIYCRLLNLGYQSHDLVA